MYSIKTVSGIGKDGEDFAAEYLRNNGYIVIKENFSNRYGEIDIIAENGDYIVFVEVKTRKTDALVSGAEAIDKQKQDRIHNLATDFLRKFKTEKKLSRFDVIEVVFDDFTNEFSVKNHIMSAF